MPGGRPRKYSDVEALQIKIDAYFKFCDDNILPYTITGLAIALDLSSRKEVMDYQGRPEFSHAIKKAKLKCEWYAEKEAMLKSNPGGPIFCLKNYGWKDTQTIDLNMKPASEMTDDELAEEIARLRG